MQGMTRREFLRGMAVGAAGVLGAGGARRLGSALAAAAGRKKLNFVFFLVDDLGWKDLTCQGSTFYDTPNVDRLAAGGMRFTDAYAACPVCSPTRASIMAGKYPARVGITNYIPGRRPGRLLDADYLHYLPLEEVTLAEALKAAGYATFFAGKWHLGSEAYWPEHQGFDVNKGGTERGGPYGGKKYFSPYGNPRLEDGPPGEHLPDRLASETARFIEANRDRPFLAYLSFYSVHTPLMARQDLQAKYQKRKQDRSLEDQWGQEGQRKVRQVQCHAVYAGMVEAMDQAVGKVLDTLDRLHLAADTAVFFMSDNGGLSTSEGHPTSNLPLRAGKGWLYEGGVREPMIIRWPGVAKGGGTCHEPVTSTDFYPTILDMAGLPLRPQQHCDGLSLVPLLKRTGKLQREAIYWHYPHYGNQGGSPGGAVRAGDWKLIEFYEDMHVELYNLKDDIGEKNDLAARMPDKADQLRKMLHDWRRAVGAKMPKPNPDWGKAKPKQAARKKAKT
jgi:arylsulfatase A-like enzyme